MNPLPPSPPNSYPHTHHGLLPIVPSSLHLSYTLRLPSASPTSLALIAHPLGRLGGSQSDHLVLSLAESLLAHGWGVLTYDARGAGASEGRASFSCVPSPPPRSS